MNSYKFKMAPFRCLMFVVLAGIAAAIDPYATVIAPDGFTYYYVRSGQRISAAAASAECAALGGTLASFASAQQVNNTLWSRDVVEVGSDGTEIIWTGLKVSWPSSNAASPAASPSGRRLLRGDSARPDEASQSADQRKQDDEEDKLDSLRAAAEVARRLQEIESSSDPVPQVTDTGARIPPMLRLWMHQQRRRALQQQQGRSLLQGGTGDEEETDGYESPFLNGAVLSWDDGTDTSFVKSNPSNFGFLSCSTRQKQKGCCGAVYDIGPAPYYPAEFPAIFFFPCDSVAASGANPPGGFTCAVDPTAQLPGGDNTGGSTPTGRTPSPSGARVCLPGTAPARKNDPKSCKVCKRNTFSQDGLKCVPCPTGKKARRGATRCK